MDKGGFHFKKTWKPRDCAKAWECEFNVTLSNIPENLGLVGAPRRESSDSQDPHWFPGNKSCQISFISLFAKFTRWVDQEGYDGQSEPRLS